MLDWQSHKKLRILIKTICIVLIISFLSYDLSWAGATEVLNPKNWYNPQERQLQSVEIPSGLGTIKESYISKYNPYKLVIHIQDAHANVEAQENEAKLIKHLKDKYKVNLVSVEGGFGDFDAEFFRSFPKDKKVRDKIAKYFLSKAFISGTDYLLITEDEPPAVYGAEDRELYANHLNTFKENQNFSDSLNKALNIVEEVIETLKNKYYSKDLKELDAKINDFRQGRISLEEYLSYLNITSIINNFDLSEFPNLYSLFTSQELEHKIDFAKAETERQDLIENLTKALDKANLEELVKNSLDFKANKLTPAEYYAYLEKLTKEAGIQVKTYNNLFTYIKYITLSENLDNSKVFNEIDEFTQKLKEKLAVTTVQKDIDNLTYIIRILKGLSDINLSPKEYEYFKKTREDFNQRRLAWLFKRYVDSSYLKSLPTDEEIASLEKFYSLAHDRDKAIVSNSINRLNRDYSSNSVIIVAGGFHTQGLTSILKEKDISYVVIAPNIKQAQDRENTYFALLKDKRIPLEDVLNDPDTLQIINSISDPEARQLLVNYWVARASRYYSTKELQVQLDRLRLSDGDQKAVEVALKEISSNTQFAKKEEPATQEDIVPKVQSIPLGPTLFERFASFISSLKPKPKETKLAQQETIPTSHKEEKQEGIIAGKEELSSAPLPAQNKKSSSPIAENIQKQEPVINPTVIIPRGTKLLERFTGFIAFLRPRPKSKEVGIASGGEQPQIAKLQHDQRDLLPQLSGSVSKGIWILMLSLSFLFFPQFSRYTFAQTHPAVQTQPYSNGQIGQILNDRFSLSEEEHTRIAPIINGIIATLNPDTKLPTSHLDDRSLNNWLLTYDAAAIAMELRISEKQKEAEQILDYFVTEYNRSLEEMHKKGDKLGVYGILRNFKHPFKEGQYLTGIINGIDSSNREGQGKDFSIHSGATAWLIMSMLQVNSQKYLPVAESLAKVLLEFQDKDGGIITNSDNPAYKAAEPHMDAVAAFKMLYQLTKNDVYRHAADKAISWFKNNCINPNNIVYKGTWFGTPHNMHATDAYTWPLLIAGESFTPEQIKQLISVLEKRSLIEVAYTRPDGQEIKIITVDFTDPEDSNIISLRRGYYPVGSTEWASGMALLYYQAAVLLWDSGDKTSAIDMKAKGDALLYDAWQTGVTNYDMTFFPYATAKWIETGHGYKTPVGNQSMAGNWIIFPDLKFNPFILGGGDIKDRLKEIPSFTLSEAKSRLMLSVVHPAYMQNQQTSFPEHDYYQWYETTFAKYGKIDPEKVTNPYHFYKQGIEQEKAGKFEEASKSYEQALRIDSNFMDALQRIAELEYRQGKFHEANRDFQRIAQIDKYNIEARIGYVQTGYLLKQITIADLEKEYKELLERFPGHFGLLINLGEVVSWQGRYKEAIGYLRQASHIYPDNPDVFRKLAEIARLDRDYDSAASYYEEVIRRASDDAKARFNMVDLKSKFCLMLYYGTMDSQGVFSVDKLNVRSVDLSYRVSPELTVNTGVKELEIQGLTDRIISIGGGYELSKDTKVSGRYSVNPDRNFYFRQSAELGVTKQVSEGTTLLSGFTWMDFPDKDVYIFSPGILQKLSPKVYVLGQYQYAMAKDSQGHSVLLRLNYEPIERLQLHVSVSAGEIESGMADFSNKAASLGIDYRINDRISIGAEYEHKDYRDFRDTNNFIIGLKIKFELLAKEFRNRLDRFGLSTWKINQILSYNPDSLKVKATMPILRLIAHIEGITVGMLLRRSLFHERLHDLFNLLKIDRSLTSEKLIAKFNKNTAKYILDTFRYEYGLFEDIVFEKLSKEQLVEIVEELVVRYYTYKFQGNADFLREPDSVERLFRNFGFEIEEVMKIGEISVQYNSIVFDNLHNLFDIEGEVTKEKQITKLYLVTEISRMLGGNPKIEFDYTREAKELEEEIRKIISSPIRSQSEASSEKGSFSVSSVKDIDNLFKTSLQNIMPHEINRVSITIDINQVNSDFLKYYLLSQMLRTAYFNWLKQYLAGLNIGLDTLHKYVIEAILDRIIISGERISEGKGINIDTNGNPQIEILRNGGGTDIIPLYEYVWQKIIESKIGGLNGRSTFAEYLLRQVKNMLGQNKSGVEILAMIDQQHQFWREILKDQLRKYDKVRDEKEGAGQKEYLLINYEFDDLFRYCEDPVREFNINLNQRLDSDAIQQLVMQFKTFLDKHRSHLPEIRYPISLTGFYLKAISFIFTHWNKIFAKTENETVKIRQAKAFWRNSILVWLGLNAIVTTFAVVGISSVPGVFALPFVVLAGILILSFLPISYRAIVYVGRAYVAWKEEKIKKIAVIKDWRRVRKRFDTLWLGLDAYQQNGYFRLIDNLYDEYKLTDSERMKLYRLDLKTAPQNEEAQQRIKNWMNKFYQKDIPIVSSWQEVRSVTIQVASLDEKFFYHWDELTSTSLEKDQIESILNYVKNIYPDEWKILIDRLGDKLTARERQLLPSSNSQIILILQNPQAVREIEKWANFRLQTVFGTLESARKAWLAYKNLARKFFPSATDEELELLVSQKVQILFLHDKYPAYATNSVQKQDIDAYLAKYPFIQLIWQEDLIHQSKSGGWANALSKVTGEFLVTLDCDHSIRDEEIEFLPSALKEFTLNSNLTGIQFKVYAYNEPFSITTKCVGLAENSWWGLDLRVKDKLGATGLYGHLIFRTEFLKRFEGIQDDSVAEDILTSVRLLKEGFDTKYIEYMRIGKGFNVTPAGMSIPYRRYPMGAIESGLSKPFIEFLLSDKVSWDKKAETLFMASYYPTQPFIILATVAYIVGAYLLPFNPYVFLPTVFFFIGLILAETINLGAIVYMTENYGLIRGIVKYLKVFPVLTVFHVSFIPQYHERTEKALKGYAKFIVTRSSSILTHESWKTIHERNRFGFKLGAVLVPLILLTPFQGIGLFVASLLFILNSFIWLTAPFILNPARNKIERVKDVIVGPLWAFATSYYEMSIGALRRQFLLGSINRYLGRHKDNLPIDRLDIGFQSLSKRAVGISDLNIIEALWNTVKILIKDARGDDQKAKDTLKSVGERIDAVIKGQLEIEDLKKGRLFENTASSPIDNKALSTQTIRGPPSHETRICLINLFSPTHPVLVRPLSIEALAGDLNKVYGSGVQVKLFDLQVEDLASIVKKIEEIKPEIIGLSVKVGSSEQLEEILKKIKTLPSLQGNAPLIVLGNILPTFASEQLLDKHKGVIIVIGEGEKAMRGLVEKVKEGNTDYSDVPNLAYIKDGEIVYTKRRALDLNEITLPSYDIVPEIVKRGGHIWLEASRGCNGHCTFCSRRPIRNNGWEPMPADKVILDVRTLATQYKVKHFRFTDDDFMGTGSPDGIEHARKIAEGIKDLHITFDISARVDSIYSSKVSPEENQQKLEIYKLLKEAGLTQAFLGIESGSTCQLKRFAKGVSVEENKKGIQLFKELGIQVVMGFITIDYLMDLEELKENIEFLEEMRVIDKDTTVFVSDPLTSLRAQEGCAYIKMLKNKGLLGPKDSSLVAYSASYKDARVGRIAYIINEWRDGTYPLVYALKNRASFVSLTKTVSLEADLLENYLYRFKQLDLDLLKQLVQLMETMDEFNIDRDKVNSLLSDFRQERMEVINSLLEEIKQGRISDKEGTLCKEAQMIMNKYRSHFDFVKALKISITAFLSVVLALFSSRPAKAENYQPQVTKLENWLLMNRDNATGLPHSHVGDDRFENWAITYDSAIATLAYIATGRINDAKRILDFYIQTPNAWRLGGIIEAVNPTNPVLGEDWSVRTGSNLWMGIASFHLYKATGESKYLELAKKLADFAISLQNSDEKDSNFGGIRLGPLGGPNVASDQHLGYDVNQPSFYEVFATEHNIDAYALFGMLYQETKETKYKKAGEMTLLWLKNVGYNKEEHRLNRGYKRGLDPVIATDIHSWGISALGVDVLDTFEPGLAEKMIEFVEKNCLSEVSYIKPNGQKVKVKGADFVDYKTAASLGRKSLVSPEWTFQLVNACRRLESDFKQRGDTGKEAKYREKRQGLIKGMLDLAIESDNALAYPYATQAEAAIGHEYNTPKEGNLSTIGVSYGILALTGFDPLVNPAEKHTKSYVLNSFIFMPFFIGSMSLTQFDPFINWLVGCISIIVTGMVMIKNRLTQQKLLPLDIYGLEHNEQQKKSDVDLMLTATQEINLPKEEESKPLSLSLGSMPFKTDPFGKELVSLNEGGIILKQEIISAINSLSEAYNGLTLELDVDTLIDTSKGSPQLKGLGFREALVSLYQAQEKKEIPENLRIRLININPALNKEKIIKVLGLTDDLLKTFVTIPNIPQDYVIKSLEPYLIKNSIRVIFEDNLRYWGKKVDVLVKRGKETEILSSLGLIVASLAKEPKFYEQLHKELKEYIVAKTDEKGNIELDDEGKIKQLIFKPIEKTKVDVQYLEQLDKANKELEGMV